MNYFGSKLTAVLAAEGKTRGQLAHEPGVSQSLVTYLATGKQSCSIKFLRKIIEASSNDPFKRADLLAAHLWDHMQAAGSSKALVQIMINADGVQQVTETPPVVKWPHTETAHAPRRRAKTLSTSHRSNAKN